MVAHQSHKLKVVGSIPTLAKRVKRYLHYYICADCSAERDVGYIIHRKGKEVIVCKKCYQRLKRKGETNG